MGSALKYFLLFTWLCGVHSVPTHTRQCLRSLHAPEFSPELSSEGVRTRVPPGSGGGRSAKHCYS